MKNAIILTTFGDESITYDIMCNDFTNFFKYYELEKENIIHEHVVILDKSKKLYNTLIKNKSSILFNSN